MFCVYICAFMHACMHGWMDAWMHGCRYVKYHRPSLLAPYMYIQYSSPTPKNIV